MNKNIVKWRNTKYYRGIKDHERVLTIMNNKIV